MLATTVQLVAANAGLEFRVVSRTKDIEIFHAVIAAVAIAMAHLKDHLVVVPAADHGTGSSVGVEGALPIGGMAAEEIQMILACVIAFCLQVAVGSARIKPRALANQCS